MNQPAASKRLPTAPAALLSEQLERIEPEPVRDPLQTLQGQIAFAALKPTHIGAVNTKFDRECLLRQAARNAIGAQVSPDPPLQLAFHRRQTCPAAT